MIITKKHTIDSYKVRKDIKILQLSDLHYNDFMDPNKLKKIIFEVFSI